MAKWVYSFGDGAAEGDGKGKELLGGKGAGLAEMSRLGLPVPPGFTITTEACAQYTANGGYPEGLDGEVAAALKKVESAVGSRFGHTGKPLLVSVRSGARISMPGMMDTVLNIGLNDSTVEGLASLSGDARFAYDSYRRFIQMYGDVVLGVDHYNFEDLLEDYKQEKGFTLDTELKAEDWKIMVAAFKKAVEREHGKPFPQEPREQLWGAIDAVFKSWNNQRAVTYRRLHNIPEDWGTAVNVQAMVFGNMGDTSATGVCFTRNPSTGDNAFYGEFLINAQGEDVVAGIRTPQPLTRAEREAGGGTALSMEEAMPQAFAELVKVRNNLERHFADMQDMEFTVQQGKLWMLQTRGGKRTAPAALRIAVDMVNEGLIDKKTAIRRIDPASLDQLLHPTLDPKAERVLLGTGLPASPGAASGRVVFSAEDAEAWTGKGEKVILVRAETSPEDIGGMHVAEGILTIRGGMTSHAAVVARGMGKPCISGAGELAINPENRTLFSKERTIQEGDVLTIDGSTGEVYVGAVPTVTPELTGDFATFMGWADEIRSMGVRANAETPRDAETAVRFGAEGIGLCRTEHMFFDPERIMHVRAMILADKEAGRRRELEKLLTFQRKDFIDLFTIMAGHPVTVRLLDPPLHEFLPEHEEDIAELAQETKTDAAAIRARVRQLSEVNPMLGHRGCRLGITYPEIYEMQARAIFEAASQVSKDGQPVKPEIMIPLVAMKKEFDILAEVIHRVAADVRDATGVALDYKIGTMIELPRAALRAGEIAQTARFFSFGTNDLTQTTFGLSRDDAGNFIQIYRDKNVMKDDPFVTIDVEAVGELVEIACERGRKTRPDISLGICGEHGGDPATIRFCQKVGLSYVSCSPYRVPIARLAAAQAALEAKG
jgi:pyruvate,orthophosphate dikinase